MDPDKYIILPDSELAADRGPLPQPHWDPKLKGSKRLRREFIAKLAKAGANLGFGSDLDKMILVAPIANHEPWLRSPAVRKVYPVIVISC